MGGGGVQMVISRGYEHFPQEAIDRLLKIVAGGIHNYQASCVSYRGITMSMTLTPDSDSGQKSTF